MTLFLLPFLAGTGREWTKVLPHLEPHFRTILLDLPGFGDSSAVPGYSVEQMSDTVTEVIHALAPETWLLVAHSMGAKIATVIARCAEDGDARLSGLRGLVLLAGSPPSPEPMDESRRGEMLSWFRGSHAQSLQQAEHYIASNANQDLSQGATDLLVEDVLRANPAAWRAWLEAGSREDWSTRVGILNTSTVLVAGELDSALGPAGQRRQMLPHFANAELKVIPNACHLLPLEQPAAVGHIIHQHARRTSISSPAVDPAYLDLIHSDRVSEVTRKVLLERAAPDDHTYEPQAISPEQLSTLRALLHIFLPQPADATIDLAGRIDRQLVAAKGDGWRYAQLPADVEAYRMGLETLNLHAQAIHAVSFASLPGETQTYLLQQAASGSLESSTKASLSAEQLRLWLEDLRGDAVRQYVGHPATLARMGYSGIADGASAATMQGFVQIGIGEREVWEPVAKPQPIDKPVNASVSSL